MKEKNAIILTMVGNIKGFSVNSELENSTIPIFPIYQCFQYRKHSVFSNN